MNRTTRLTPQILATSALLAWGVAPPSLVSGTTGHVRDVLRNDLPNRAEYERMERGYYEQILDTGRRLDAPAPARAEPPRLDHGRLTLSVDDVREFVLKPGLVYDSSRQVSWSTNAHGMRDRDYAVSKPPGTFRVALAGDSIASGWGVADDDGFEPRLEAAFDARSRQAGGPAVEVLNFAVPGHGPGPRWCHFDRVGWQFSPDLVIYEASPADPGWDERRLRALLPRGIGFDEPAYRGVLAGAGVKPGLGPDEYKASLRPLRWELLEGVYRAAAAECRSRGVPAVWVLIPRVGKPADPAERRRLVATAHGAGFSAVVDASDVFDGADPAGLAVAPNDFHPNAEGHARIARRLDEALSALPELSHLWTRPAETKEGGPR
jgi:hypothetical protein